MKDPASVTQWLDCLREGDAAAAEKLWNRYAVRLVELARRRMGAMPRGVADEEDIAQSVFSSICRGAAAGRFHDLHNRDDLWWLLIGITKQKVVDLIRRETASKRGSGRVQQASTLVNGDGDRNPFCRLVSDEPTPEFVAMLREQSERLLELLRDDQLRRIAVLRIEGFTVAEIAADLPLSVRSVERKLALIREAWSHEFEL